MTCWLFSAHLPRWRMRAMNASSEVSLFDCEVRRAVEVRCDMAERLDGMRPANQPGDRRPGDTRLEPGDPGAAGASGTPLGWRPECRRRANHSRGWSRWPGV